MVLLDDIKVSSRIEGLEPGQAVTIVSVERLGNDRLRVYYRCRNGEIRDQRLFRSDEAGLILLSAPDGQDVESEARSMPCASDPPIARADVPVDVENISEWLKGHRAALSKTLGIPESALTVRVHKQKDGSMCALTYRTEKPRTFSGEDTMTVEQESAKAARKSAKGELLMNMVQRIWIYLGIIALITMALFPPWTHTVKNRWASVEEPAGYLFVASPPQKKNHNIRSAWV